MIKESKIPNIDTPTFKAKFTSTITKIKFNAIIKMFKNIKRLQFVFDLSTSVAFKTLSPVNSSSIDTLKYLAISIVA